MEWNNLAVLERSSHFLLFVYSFAWLFSSGLYNNMYLHGGVKFLASFSRRILSIRLCRGFSSFLFSYSYIMFLEGEKNMEMKNKENLGRIFESRRVEREFGSPFKNAVSLLMW